MKYYAVLLAGVLLPVCGRAQNLTPPVGIGTTTPKFILHVSTNSASGFAVQNTAALSSSSGAFIRCYNSGIPSAANHRLGGILFGTTPGGTTFRTGAQIQALSAGAWTDGSSLPTYLSFLTVPSGTTVSAERMRISAEGNVGIGTSSPLNSTNNAGLHISKGNHSTIVLGDPFNGYGGFVQTSDNKHRVFIGANFYDDVTGSWKVAQSGKGVAGISIIADEGAFGTAIDFVTSSGSTYNRSMSIVGNGNVGIGTMTPQAKLAVNGDVFAKKVKVTQSGWPDYVFAEDYKLPPLAELENYIKAHQHLPDMPTAMEVENEGLDLGEMNKKLLQKVEELTLYLIQVNKQNQELKAEIEMLKSRIK